MGDSENAQQPSKKRAALKELSRENPGLDDADEESSALTFKTASEEVLATRRIVRVKRRDPSATATPLSNPFAGTRFTALAETNKPLSVSEETRDDGRSDATKEVIDGGEKDKSEATYTGGPENKSKDEIKTITEMEGAAEEETEKGNDDNDNSTTDKGTDSVDKDSGGDTDQTGKKCNRR